MTNLRQAAQQALDALEQYKGVVVTHHDPESFRRMEVDGGQAARDAIDALRAALAEPEQDDPALTYCHRFAILMECVMLGGVDKHWNEIGVLLDEYHSAQNKWREAHGEPYISGFGKD
jgi:hypothetical protein